jgi:hypothetical protein
MSCPQDTSPGEDDSELGPDAHVGCRWRGIFETNPMRGVRQGFSRLARGVLRNQAATASITFGWLLAQRQVPMASWNRDGSVMATWRRTRPRPCSAPGSHDAPRDPFFGTGPMHEPRFVYATRGPGDITSDRASTSRPLRWARGSRPATTSVAGSRERTCLPGRGEGQEGRPPGPTPGHADWTNREDQPALPAQFHCSSRTAKVMAGSGKGQLPASSLVCAKDPSGHPAQVPEAQPTPEGRQTGPPRKRQTPWLRRRSATL